jgi:hypothetical protein
MFAPISFIRHKHHFNQVIASCFYGYANIMRLCVVYTECLRNEIAISVALYLKSNATAQSVYRVRWKEGRKLLRWCETLVRVFQQVVKNLSVFMKLSRKRWNSSATHTHHRHNTHHTHQTHKPHTKHTQHIKDTQNTPHTNTPNSHNISKTHKTHHIHTTHKHRSLYYFNCYY